MDLTKETLSIIAGSNPGNFGVYQMEGGRIVQILQSPGLEELVGMEEKEYRACVGYDAAAIVAESDRPVLNKRLSRILREGGDAELDFRVQHKTKGSIWLHARARIIGKMDGVPVIMAVFMDSGAESVELEVLLGNAATQVYVVDIRTYEVLYANEQLKTFWQDMDFSGHTCFHMVNGRKEPCPWCMLPKMKHGNYFQKELYSETTQTWYNALCRPMDWHGHEAAAIYIFDITEEKERRRVLESDKKSLETIVENIPVGVGVSLVKDQSVEVVAVNTRMSEAFGIKREDFDFADPGIMKKVHSGDAQELIRVMRMCAIPGTDEVLDYRFRRSDDAGYRWYRQMVRTIRTEDGVMAFTCLTDVTAEKKAEAEMRTNRLLYQVAASAGKMVIWEYDPVTRRIRMMFNSAYTREVCLRLGIPEVIENGPESLADMIAGEDRSAFWICTAISKAAARKPPAPSASIRRRNRCFGR